jgi:hypothetical protein
VGVGFGGRGFGFGGMGPNPQSPLPNPQSPIPNPQFIYKFKTIFKKNNLLFIAELKKYYS